MKNKDPGNFKYSNSCIRINMNPCASRRKVVCLFKNSIFEYDMNNNKIKSTKAIIIRSGLGRGRNESE